MQFELLAHPSTGRGAADAVYADVGRSAPAMLDLWYVVSGRLSEIVIPPRARGTRTDGLWQSTCFELFARRAHEEGYLEWNFSPSGEWAAYAFSSYRQGRRQLSLPAPPIVSASTSATGNLEVRVTLDFRFEPGEWTIGLSAILAERTGVRTYWALAHPSGEPDFHHADCFAARLP